MRCALIWLVFLCAAVSAWAVNPNIRISQYRHTAWRVQDGFFDGVPYRTAQTRDGYLWIATANGLLRFDGVRFVPSMPPPGKQLPSSLVAGVMAARDGSLWTGTTRGLSHWINQDVINYSSSPNAVMAPMFEDEDGTIWALRAGTADETGPLCQVRGLAMQCYGKADGIPQEVYSAIVPDSAGNFWLGGGTSLTRWRAGSFQTYYPSGLKGNVGPGVSAIAPRPDGSVWVGTTGPGHGVGLQLFSQGVEKPFVVPGFDSSTLQVVSLLLDRQNALWVGTLGQGVYRIYGRKVDHFGSSDGLSSDTVYGFFEDQEGDLWVTTNKGIDYFREMPITSFSTREGLTTPAVSTVQAMRDGSIWIGGAFALNILGPGLDQDSVRSVQQGKGLPGNQVTSIFEDHAGRHWVGIERSLYIYENGRFATITRRDGSPIGTVFGITEDVDNNLWVVSLGPQRMLIRIFDRKVQEELSTPKIPAATSIAADSRGGIWLGLLNGDLARYWQGRLETFHFDHTPSSRVNQVLVDSDGSVLGATAFGLIGWSDGKQETLSSRNGLPCDGVNALIEGDSTLWLYQQCGVVEIAKTDLQRWWAQPNVKLQPRVFDVFDGFQAGHYSPFESQAARTQDGRLWFTNATVAQMIDPRHLARNLTPPPVHVEHVIADRKSYWPRGDVRLPAHTRDVEVDYTALSFAVPQKVRFRYRLESRDTDWQEAGTRRQAFYTDLRPGRYRFHVIACNNDGVWNNDGAVLNFSVAAAWYQTGWFRTSIAVALLLALGGIYQLRLLRLAHQFNIRLEERVGERTRIARDLHDTLLQSFQGLMLHLQTGIDLLPGRPAEARKTLETAMDRADQAIAEGRDAVQGLRASTIETHDLTSAIRTLGEELRAEGANQNSALFEMKVEGTPRTLHPMMRDEVYRIAGEALRNAFRHARAQRIEVEILYEERWLRLRVRDDGKGIDPRLLSGVGPAGHYGLHGMRERAKLVGGRLAVWSKLDSGTEVELSIPASTAYSKPGRPRSWLSEKLSGRVPDFRETDVKETKAKS